MICELELCVPLLCALIGSYFLAFFPVMESRAHARTLCASLL
jgi:hypothetical protein